MSGNRILGFPSAGETRVLVLSMVLWLAVTAMFVGLRPEHIFLGILIACMFEAAPASRRLVVALLPFIVFGISYDWMNIVHNYDVNPVDIAGLNAAERSLFGINYGGSVLTPNEFFALHTNRFLDILGGVFYLCWVPVPIAFGLWLYFKHRESEYLHFSLVFLFVNFIGFAGYYIHPAAPPWYVAKYGFDFIAGTPGDVAGLGGFDEFTGLGIFNGLYGRNSNVFAAVPSLHSAYTLVAFIYSLRGRNPLWIRIALGVITLGIWFTAVYTSHHYLIDVLLGIGCALLGFVLFEYVLMRIPAFARFISAYARYISGPASQQKA